MCSLDTIIKRIDNHRVRQQIFSAGELHDIEQRLEKLHYDFLSKEIISYGNATEILRCVFYYITTKIKCISYSEQILEIFNQTAIVNGEIHPVIKEYYFCETVDENDIYYGIENFYQNATTLFSERGKSVFRDGGQVSYQVISKIARDYVFNSYFMETFMKLFAKIEDLLENSEIIDVERQIDLEMYFRKNGMYCKEKIIEYCSICRNQIYQDQEGKNVLVKPFLCAISAFSDICSNYCHVIFTEDILLEINGMYECMFGGILNG